MANMSIREFIKRFDNGEFDSPDVKTQCEAGWYDWFCRDTSLRNKTIFLAKRLKTLLDSPLIDQDKMYVFFKNNCPVQGKLYDDFRICDLETGDVIYCIIPSLGYSMYDKDGNPPAISGKFNGFEDRIFKNWNELKKVFISGNL
uniref:Uncharacterized protein n=1 Tax=Ochrobactrum phage ORM_20 TaxID=2985243 RepID=A0A9N6WV24_9VIRU|nr:hypothetical protein ORM20_00177 [Ochrobactrum phage ORM_20]